MDSNRNMAIVKLKINYKAQKIKPGPIHGLKIIERAMKLE
jgi:hypothetical protein